MSPLLRCEVLGDQAVGRSNVGEGWGGMLWKKWKNPYKNNLKCNKEKDQLLEVHLLEKTAKHQNLDCSTVNTVRADAKKNETA
jgi:hypothetical protein